jgi:hypothetical protein
MAGYLQGNRINIALARDVADNAVGSRFPGYSRNGFRTAGNEGDAGTTSRESPDECQTEA